MTIVQTEDNRNQEWRNSNVGSKMLAKMGWTEGSGIGKRNVNTTALRAVKRQEGLGIGAKRQTEGGPSESTGTFAAVLANLQAHHGTSNNNNNNNNTTTAKLSKKEAKKAAKAAKKAKKKLSLPQNKVLAGHARKMRAAKFGAKSAQDLACIFGNTEVVETALGGAFRIPAVKAADTKSKKRAASSSSSSSSDSDSDEEKRASKKRKKEKRADDKKHKKNKKEKKSKKDKKKKSKSD